jgi:hypothetical protein
LQCVHGFAQARTLQDLAKKVANIVLRRGKHGHDQVEKPKPTIEGCEA